MGVVKSLTGHVSSTGDLRNLGEPLVITEGSLQGAPRRTTALSGCIQKEQRFLL